MGYPCDEHEDADRLGRCGRRRCDEMNCVSTRHRMSGLPIGGPCGVSYRTCHSRRPSLPRLTFASEGAARICTSIRRRPKRSRGR
eukprot:gene7657-biopygen28